MAVLAVGLTSACKHSDSAASAAATAAPSGPASVAVSQPTIDPTDKINAIIEAGGMVEVPAPAPGGRFVVAVAPFIGSDGAPGTLGLLFADHIARSLTVTGPVDATTNQRSYPAEVFSWRQTASAARAAGIAPDAIASRASELLLELGAHRLVAGSYKVDGDKVMLTWQTVGGPKNMGHEISFALKDQSKTAYAIGAQVLADTGTDTMGTAPAPLSKTAATNWGTALSILAQQSRTARASVVLPKDKLSKAQAALAAVTKRAPDFAPGWAAKAVVTVMAGDWDAAKATLTKAKAVSDAADPAAALATYYVFEQMTMRDDARAVLKQAVEQHPGSLEVLGYLGDAHYSIGEYDKALPVFDAYIARVPYSPYAQRRRNAILARLGRKDEALRNAEILFAQHPKSVTILASLSSRQIDAGKLDEAKRLLNAGLKMHKDHPLLLTRLSYVELEGGDANKALTLAEKAVAQLGTGRGEPLAGYAHIDLARALAVVGRRDEAKASLYKAVRLGVNASDLDRLARDPRLNGFIKFPIVLPAEEQ